MFRRSSKHLLLSPLLDPASEGGSCLQSAAGAAARGLCNPEHRRVPLLRLLQHPTASKTKMQVCLSATRPVGTAKPSFHHPRLTGIDDFQIPGYTGGFVLQLARPVEWVLTHPVSNSHRKASATDRCCCVDCLWCADMRCRVLGFRC